MKNTLITLGIGATILGGGNVIDSSINQYVDKGGHYETFIGEDKVKIDKDSNEVEYYIWGGENILKIKAIGDYEKSERKLLSNTREALSKDKSTTLIIEPIEGGINVDTILHKKPDTNVFSYELTGWEEYNFAYQFPLTPEEIAQGDVRPDNVVGSYAVYHKTKKDNGYKTGKAFHIYRPEIIDDNGDRVWGELNFNNGVLQVFVQQEFLDNAKYPVLVDPTLGQTSCGASNSTHTTPTMFAIVATSTQDGTVDSISMCIDGNGVGTVNVKGVLLAYVPNNSTILANGVSPSALLPSTAGGSFTTIAYSSSPSITTGTGYAIAGVADATVRYYYDSPGGTQGWTDPTNSYATPQNTGAENVATRRQSHYITYTVSGGGGSPVSEEESLMILD